MTNSSKNTTSQKMSVQQVRTFNDEDDSKSSKQTKEIDISSLSKQEIESLHSTDPFMYFSIPAIRNAAVLGRDIDHSNNSLQEAGTRRYTTTIPAEPVPKRSKTMVRRRQRISFETHSMVLLEEFINMMEVPTAATAAVSDDEDETN